MYRFFGEQDAYSLINSYAPVIADIIAFFFIKSKLKVPNIYARCIGTLASRKSLKLGKIIFVTLIVLEFFLSLRHVMFTPSLNAPFGELVGTGFNYFATIFALPIVFLVLSVVFVVDPLKNTDVLTMGVPVFLFVVKIACFCNGCCWGIPWEHGLYNHHYDHPGRQVPVQAIEAFFAVFIFVFLLIYRKKAKPGRLYPMYVILYSGTRFFSEFLTAAYPNVLGPFNTYQILCAIGIVYGLFMLLIAVRFGERITATYEKFHEKIDAKISNIGKEKITK